MIFDTHAHYDDRQFDEDRDELLLSLKAHGISCLVDVGASLESTRQAVQLADKYPFIYCAAGVHPSETAELNEENFEGLCKLISNGKITNKKTAEEFSGSSQNKIVAVGEIGLDYYWNEPDAQIQEKWFKKQLELAIKEELPVIIHSRDAAADTLNIIQQYYDMARQQQKNLGGVIHCFSYSWEMAEKYIDMGFYLGIGGVVTFKNAKKVKEVVYNMPLDKLVIETDCPYLSPEPFRGTRNSSKNLVHVVKYISELRNISTEELEKITFENSLKLYGIKQ